MADVTAARTRGITLDDRPVPWGAWLADVRAHGEVFSILVRKDFQTRFMRASLGVLWAVAVPILQGLVMAFVFSKVIKTGGGGGFAAYVMSGTLAWSYFAGTLGSGVTSIVDGSALTDKVWFPRILLVGVPVISNIVSLLISLAVLLIIGPFLGADLGVRLLLLIPATTLMVLLATGFSTVLAALHVYFRDTKFVVQAALLVWMYVTPIVYHPSLLGHWAPWLQANPMTGVVAVFHEAIGQTGDPLARPVIVSLAFTAVLLAVGLGAQRRHDRLFVDRL
jgi:ABC-type polysaccharide/polyol phosphate export permease